MQFIGPGNGMAFIRHISHGYTTGIGILRAISQHISNVFLRMNNFEAVMTSKVTQQQGIVREMSVSWSSQANR
jgi:hypothetical protein